MSKCAVNWPSLNWEQSISWAANEWKGNKLQIVINKLALSSYVYSIWRERNARLFRNEYKDLCSIQKEIVHSIWARLLSI